MHYSSPVFANLFTYRSCPFCAGPDPHGKHALLVGSWPVKPQGLLECIGAQYVLHVMWMVLPNQAGSLQGVSSVNCILLAANDLGTGSGWQQSRQNWTLPAVVGHWIRMTCSLLCCAEDALLQSFFFLANSPVLRSLHWPDPAGQDGLLVDFWPVQPQGLLECIGAQYVMHAMWMALPDESGSMQGVSRVTCIILSANDMGTGSG